MSSGPALQYLWVDFTAQSTNTQSTTFSNIDEEGLIKLLLKENKEYEEKIGKEFYCLPGIIRKGRY